MFVIGVNKRMNTLDRSIVEDSVFTNKRRAHPMREGEPCQDNMNTSYINLNHISNTKTQK